MSDISYLVLCSRFLTPLQDCKVCAGLPSDDPEAGQEECKAGILSNIDGLLIDVEEALEDEALKEGKIKFETLIRILISFKKVCFYCDCKIPRMHDMHREMGGEIESSTFQKGQSAQKDVVLRSVIPIGQSKKK